MYNVFMSSILFSMEILNLNMRGNVLALKKKKTVISIYLAVIILIIVQLIEKQFCSFYFFYLDLFIWELHRKLLTIILPLQNYYTYCGTCS